MKFIYKAFLTIGIISLPFQAMARESSRSSSPEALTQKAAFFAWTGSSGRICKNCYDANLPLKERIAMTTQLALELQNQGYCLMDSVGIAKASVEASVGGCYVPICRTYLSTIANG